MFAENDALRSEVFVTTKLYTHDHGYGACKRAVEESLAYVSVRSLCFWRTFSGFMFDFKEAWTVPGLLLQEYFLLPRACNHKTVQSRPWIRACKRAVEESPACVFECTCQRKELSLPTKRTDSAFFRLRRMSGPRAFGPAAPEMFLIKWCIGMAIPERVPKRTSADGYGSRLLF